MSSNNQKVKVSVWLAALVTAGVVWFQGDKVISVIHDKRDFQEGVNERLDIHINTHYALKSNTAGWDDGLSSVQDIKDLLGLYEAFDFTAYGINHPLESFNLQDSSVYLVNEQDIGLIEVCVQNGNSSLTINAPSYKMLLNGIDSITSRSDIGFDGVTIYGGAETPEADLENLCMLMRSSGRDQGGEE